MRMRQIGLLAIGSTVFQARFKMRASILPAELRRRARNPDWLACLAVMNYDRNRNGILA